MREDGTIVDVRYGGPAQKAGVAPSVKLIAVNSRQFTPTVLREAVGRADKPVDLLVKNGEYYQTHHVDYTGGERYPHLVRSDGADDLLSRIIAARLSSVTMGRPRRNRVHEEIQRMRRTFLAMLLSMPPPLSASRRPSKWLPSSRRPRRLGSAQHDGTDRGGPGTPIRASYQTSHLRKSSCRRMT